MRNIGLFGMQKDKKKKHAAGCRCEECMEKSSGAGLSFGM